MKEFIEAFRVLRHAPRALWLVIFAFAADGMAYFGILPLMKAYLASDLGIAPEWASTWVSVFTGALTVLMLVVGKPAEDRLGIRGGLILALVLTLFGRGLYGSSPFVGGRATLALALLVIAVGEAVLQPVAYAGVKRYTDDKTGPMGYALLYALMNLGAGLMGPVSAKVRTTVDALHAKGETPLSGFNAVNWTCWGFTLATLVIFFVGMTPRAAEQVVVRDAPASTESGGPPSKDPRASPFRNKRFLFFIFALLPVRTLFAHQWLTMPEYVLRSYSSDIADRMEWLVESINPLIIFLGVPTLTALTKRYHVLTMMIVGSSVSAVSTFLLATGTSPGRLIAFFVFFSIGEALWSSRFLEYAAEIAPEGRVAQYMGVANLPWFVAKTTTGLYSGFVLEHFCPKTGARSAETMWLLYGAIAVVSPLLLIAARKWVVAGLATRKAV